MKDRYTVRKRIIAALIISHLVLFCVAAVYAILTELAIADGRDLVTCHFKESFGLYCPGCGGSRAVLLLFKLDPLGSFISNPVPLVSLVLILMLDLRAICAAKRNSMGPLKRARLSLLAIIPALALAVFLLRLYLVLCLGIDPLGDL